MSVKEIMSARSMLVLLGCLIGPISGVAHAQRASEPVPTTLRDFVAKPDDSFSWKLVDRSETDGAVTFQVELTSQTWQDITWKHDLLVFQPARLKHPDHVLLFITGGSNGNKPKADDRLLGASLAMLSELASPSCFKCRINRCWADASRMT